MSARDGSRLVYRIKGELHRVNLSMDQAYDIRERLRVKADLRREIRNAEGKLFSLSHHRDSRSKDIIDILNKDFQITADDSGLACFVNYDNTRR